MSRPEIKVIKTWEELRGEIAGIREDEMSQEDHQTYAALISHVFCAEKLGFVNLTNYGMTAYNKLLLNRSSGKLIALFGRFNCYIENPASTSENLSKWVDDFKIFFECMQNPGIEKMQVFVQVGTLGHSGIFELNIEKKEGSFEIGLHFYDSLNSIRTYEVRCHSFLRSIVYPALNGNSVLSLFKMASASITRHLAGTEIAHQSDNYNCHLISSWYIYKRILGSGGNDSFSKDLKFSDDNDWFPNGAKAWKLELLKLGLEMQDRNLVNAFLSMMISRPTTLEIEQGYTEKCIEYADGGVKYLEEQSDVLFKFDIVMGSDIVRRSGSNVTRIEAITDISSFYNNYVPEAGHGASRKFFRPIGVNGNDSSFSCSASAIKTDDAIAREASTAIATALIDGQKKFGFIPRDVAIIILIAVKNRGISSANKEQLKNDFTCAYRDMIPTVRIDDDYIKRARGLSANFQHFMEEKGFLTGNTSPDANIVGMRLKRLTKEHAAAFCGSDRFVDMINLRLGVKELHASMVEAASTSDDITSARPGTTPGSAELHKKGGENKKDCIVM